MAGSLVFSGVLVARDHVYRKVGGVAGASPHRTAVRITALFLKDRRVWQGVVARQRAVDNEREFRIVHSQFRDVELGFSAQICKSLEQILTGVARIHRGWRRNWISQVRHQCAIGILGDTPICIALRARRPMRKLTKPLLFSHDGVLSPLLANINSTVKL